MTTTNWKALLAVTIITLTLSKVNGLPISSSLQRKELQQNLGPSGSTVDGDLGTVGTTVEGLTSSLGLSSRQALDNLSGALQTNDLYDGLTGTRKRSPLVFNSPLAVGGSSKGSPAAQTGGVDAGTDDSDSRRKRSPLVFNSPLAVGGSSKGSPAGETGGISGKRDSILEGIPFIGGGDGEGGSNPLSSLTGGGGEGGGSNPLSGLTSSLPIPIKREGSGLGIDGLTGGLLGQSNPLSSLTGGGGESGGSPLSGLTSSLPVPIKRQGSGLGIDGLTGGLLGQSNPLSSLAGGGGESGGSPLTGLTSSLPIPIKRQGLPIDGLTSGLLGQGSPLSSLTGGGEGGGSPLSSLTGGRGEGGGSPLTGLTSSLPIPIKRESSEHEEEHEENGEEDGHKGLDLSSFTGGMTNALTKEKSPLSSLTNNLPITNVIPFQNLGKQLHSDTKGTTNSLEDDDNHIDGNTSDGTNKLSSQLGSDVNKMVQNKRSPLAGQLGGLTQDLPFGSILGGNSGENGGADGNVTPHSVSEAPEEDEQDLPEGKTQKSGTDIGAHLMGGDKKPDTIKIENTGKDATNNHGASRGKTDLSSSIGGDKATKVNLKQKTKDRMNGGEEEGTKGKSSDVGLQTGGGKSTDLDIKNNQSKKTNDYSRRR